MEQRIYSLNKLYKILKKEALNFGNSKDVESIMPHFKYFAKHLAENDRSFYSINEGISAIKKCFAENEISNGATFTRRLIQTFASKENETYGLNQLLRELKKCDLVFTLGDRPFPDFKRFKSSFVGTDKTKFTIKEGISILKAYSEGRVLDFQVALKHDLRLKKALRQNKMMQNKDESGLLGVGKGINKYPKSSLK